jgi:hypothetical protein
MKLTWVIGFGYITNYVHSKKTSGESILSEYLYIFREEN